MKKQEPIKQFKISLDNVTATKLEEEHNIVDLYEYQKGIEGSRIIAIQGKVDSKRFRVDGKTIKVTKKIDGIPVQGIDETTGELTDLFGKLLVAYRAIKELWLAIKRIFA